MNPPVSVGATFKQWQFLAPLLATFVVAGVAVFRFQDTHRDTIALIDLWWAWERF